MIESRQFVYLFSTLTLAIHISQILFYKLYVLMDNLSQQNLLLMAAYNMKLVYCLHYFRRLEQSDYLQASRSSQTQRNIDISALFLSGT